MTSAYFDASALVSLFIDDEFSERVRTFVRSGSDAMVLSDWTVAEAVSAIARGVRTRVLSAEGAQRVLAGIDGWLSSAAERLEIAPADIRAAEQILRSFDTSLRTPDALHVVVARRLQLPLVTFDLAMARDARRLGVDVVSA